MIANHELADDQDQAHHDEHAQWLEHISRWREANQQALALMTCLRKRIVEHGEDLVIHEHAIVAHEQQLTRLEPGMEGIGKSDAGAEIASPIAVHVGSTDTSTDTHGTERERHDELGRVQRHLEAIIERLQEVLDVCH
jgi:hypothetical protein